MNHVLLVICALAVQMATAVAFAADPNDKVDLKKLVVKGTVPGPDLWRVSNGQNELWILGTLSPLPKRMKWNSLPIELVIQSSQAIMLPPSITFDFDDLGFFKKLSLAKSAIGITKNPEKEKLIDLVPHDVYQRWLRLKKKYLGRNKGVEKKRPLFAGHQLFKKALKKNGLTQDTKIAKKLLKVAKKHQVSVINPQLKLKLTDPKSIAKQFKKTAIDDISCFDKTLNRIETDLPTMKKRALAWSYGDVKTIQSLPYDSQDIACQTAFLNSSIAQDMGLEESRIRLQNIWLNHAKTALETHRSTFAIIPISHLLKEQGVLFELESANYQIEPPSTLTEEAVEISEAK